MSPLGGLSAHVIPVTDVLTGEDTAKATILFFSREKNSDPSRPVDPLRSIFKT